MYLYIEVTYHWEIKETLNKSETLNNFWKKLWMKLEIGL